MAFLCYIHLTKSSIQNFWTAKGQGGIQVDTGENSSVTIWMRQVDDATAVEGDTLFESGDAIYFYDPLKLTYRCFRVDGDYTARTYTEL